MKNISYYLFLFIFGAAGYSILEVIWKGSTHWSMALDGGICLMMISVINSRLENRSLLLRAFLCMLFITALELVTGVIFNLHLKMDIWDYSDRFMNFYGQICLLYSFLWFLLSYFILYVTQRLRKIKIFMLKRN